MNGQMGECSERRDQQDAADAHCADQRANTECGEKQPGKIRQKRLYTKKVAPEVESRMPAQRLAGSECRQVAGDEFIDLFHQPETQAVIGFHQQQ